MMTATFDPAMLYYCYILLYITLNPIVGVAYRKIESISGASGAGKQQQQEQIQLREYA